MAGTMGRLEEDARPVQWANIGDRVPQILLNASIAPLVNILTRKPTMLLQTASIVIRGNTLPTLRWDRQMLARIVSEENSLQVQVQQMYPLAHHVVPGPMLHFWVRACVKIVVREHTQLGLDEQVQAHAFSAKLANTRALKLQARPQRANFVHQRGPNPPLARQANLPARRNVQQVITRPTIAASHAR
jgi:hypothetical protein